LHPCSLRLFPAAIFWARSTGGSVLLHGRGEVELPLHRLGHDAKDDVRNIADFVLLTAAVGLAVLVWVLALEEPCRGGPVLVACKGGSADGREQRVLELSLFLLI
jgi:hypothetical protein